MQYVELLDSIVNIMRKNGKMKVMEIFRAVQNIDKSIRYSTVEVVVRNSVSKDDSPFVRVGKGVYSLNTKIVRRFIKQRFQLNNHIVSNNLQNRVEVKATTNEFDPEQHLGFIRMVSEKIAKQYKLDSEDIFHEAISLAYEHKHKFNSDLGNPTTFILNQVANRLRNRVTRDLVPSFHKTEYIEQEDGQVLKKNVRVKVSLISLNAVTKSIDDSETELIDYLNDDLIHNDYCRFECRPDLDIEDVDCNYKIRKILKNLDEKEALIITKFFGIDNERKTLDEIGEELNLSKERVRQIKLKAMKRLREKLSFLAAA